MMWYLLLAALAALPLAVAITRPRSRTSWAWLGGMALFYTGQRLLDGADEAFAFNAMGLLVLIVSFGLRMRELTNATGTQAQTQRSALIFQLIGTVSLLLYALTLDPMTEGLGLSEEGLSRWTVSFGAVWPIVWLAGALPMSMLDVALGDHPVRLPNGARTNAIETGLALAFGISLVFPANYLANEHDLDADFSYFRVTEVGSSTMALARNLDEPVDIKLFYPPGSDVKEKILPYFEELSDTSKGTLTITVLDQAMAPTVSKDLGVRDNGYIVLTRGDASEKFKLTDDIDRAKRDLKKLDSLVQKHLLKLTQGKRIAYMMTGHGEASARQENPFYKLTEFKKLLREQNYDVKDFGIESGSTDAVPDDAALVMLPSPERTLLPEETETLKRYVDAGGALLVYGDPTRDRMEGLLSHLGLALDEHALAHSSKFAVATRGPIDQYNLVTNRFGSHASVATLSKYSSKAAMVFLTAAGLTETSGGALPGPAKYTPLIRSFDDTWPDLDGDLRQGPDEKGGTHVLAMAVQGPETAPYRVIVVGDIATAGDFLTQRFAGNNQFLLDATRWLVGDEDITGDVSSEEDVKITHTREGDAAWFYGTIFGVPLLVLAFGTLFVTRRTRRAGR